MPGKAWTAVLLLLGVALTAFPRAWSDLLLVGCIISIVLLASKL